MKTLIKRVLSKLGYRSQQWGDWTNLDNNSQLPRYQAIAELIHKYCPFGSLLDIGCGAGLMLPHFNQDRSYLGIDRSAAAIKLARKQVTNIMLQSFLAGNIDGWRLCRQFDIILFNEVVYYFDDPIKTVAETLSLNLTKSGFVIISVWHGDDEAKTKRNTEAWRSLCEAFGPWLESRCVKVGNGYSTIAIWKR